GGAVIPSQELTDGSPALLCEGGNLHTEAGIRGASLPEHGGLIAGAPVCREHKAVSASDIGDAAVAQIPQIVCRLLPRQHIVIIDVNGLGGELVGLPDEDKEQAYPVEIVNDGILLPGIEDDKAVRLPAAGHGADGL